MRATAKALKPGKKPEKRHGFLRLVPGFGGGGGKSARPAAPKAARPVVLFVPGAEAPAARAGVSIGTKFLALILFTLLAAVAVIVTTAVSMFKRDNLDNIYFASDLLTAAKASEVRFWMDSIIRKGTVIGTALLDGEDKEKVGQRLLEGFQTDAELLSVTLYERVHAPGPLSYQGTNNWVNYRLSEPLGLTTDRFNELWNAAGIRFDQVSVGSADVKGTVLPGGQSVLIVNVPLVQGPPGIFDVVLSIFVKQDHLLRSFSDTGAYTLALVDREGRIITHPDTTRTKNRESMASVPIVRRMLESTVDREFQEFTMGESQYLGSYAKVGFARLGVVSQIPRSVAFESGQILIRRSVLIAVLALSIAFILAYIFAQTLISPILKLSRAAKQIARGNFSVRVKVRTRDEMRDLATSFNTMGQEIERKIENLSRINEASKVISSTLDSKRLLEFSLDTLMELLDCGRGIGWLSNGAVLEAGRVTRKLTVTRDWYAAGADPIEKIGEKLTESPASYVTDVGGVSLLVVPMSEKGKIAGYLTLAQRKSGRLFTDEDSFIAGTIMTSVGITFENINLLKQTVEDAKLKKELETSAMVNKMRLGVFSVAEGGMVRGNVSTYSDTIFGQKLDDSSVLETVYKNLDPKSELYSGLKTALATVFNESEIQWELMSEAFPARFSYTRPSGEVRALRAAYTPLWDEAGNLKQILFVIEDVTDLERFEAEAAAAKAAAAENNQILQELAELDTQTVEAFLKSACETMRRGEVNARNSLMQPVDLTELFRDLHTQKGNARTYKLSLVSGSIHKVEDTLMEIRDHAKAGGKTDAAMVAKIVDGLHEILRTLRKYTRLAKRIFKIEDVLEATAAHEYHLSVAILDRLSAQAELAAEDVTGPLAVIRDFAREIDDKPLLDAASKLEGTVTAAGEAAAQSDVHEQLASVLKAAAAPLFRPGQATAIRWDAGAWATLVAKTLAFGAGKADEGGAAAKLAQFCETQRFDYPAALFHAYAGLAEPAARKAVLGQVWRTIAINSFLEIDRKLDTAARGALRAAIGGAPGSLAALNGAGCFLLTALKGLEERGVAPSQIFKTAGLALDAFLPPGQLKNSAQVDAIQEILKASLYSTEVVEKLRAAAEAGNAFSGALADYLAVTPELPGGPAGYVRFADLARAVRAYTHGDGAARTSNLPRMAEVVEADVFALQKACAAINAGQSRELQLVVSRIKHLLDIPVALVTANFPTMVYDISRALSKQVSFKLKGDDIRLHRNYLYPLQDALTHMLRNSVDHGIELPAARAASGKDPTGKVELEFRKDPKTGSILICIRDDGHGIDIERLAKKAIDKGLVTAEGLERGGEEEKLNLIFLPGLSTADRVTEISGRGVGMDVVKKCVERMGSRLRVRNKPGQGVEIWFALDARAKKPMDVAS